VILNSFEQAVAQGKNISVDWNFAPSIWGKDDGKASFELLCSLNPLLKLSEDDWERFMGTKTSIETAKAQLDACPAAVICLTCGKDGVWYKSADHPAWQHQPALPAEVKDSTGAGDAFWAGFLHAYTRGYCTNDCVQEGLKIAALKVEKVGPLYA
jgi:fructokinase